MNLSLYNNKHNPIYANRSKDKKRKKEAFNIKHSFYSTAQWKRLRQLTLRDNPLCVRCDIRGYTKEATVVDHVLVFSDVSDPLATDTDNLRSLCHKCHAVVTNEEMHMRDEWLDRYSKGESIESIAQDKYKKTLDVVDDDGYYV